MSDSLIIPLFFYLVVKRLMIATNFVVKIKNLVVNHESRPVKSNTVNVLQFSLLCSFSCSGGYSVRCLGVIISPYYLNTRTTMSFPFYYI